MDEERRQREGKSMEGNDERSAALGLLFQEGNQYRLKEETKEGVLIVINIINYNILLNNKIEQMAVSETSFNRKKVNYVARKRTKER